MYHLQVNHPHAPNKVYAPCGKERWNFDTHNYHVFTLCSGIVNCPDCIDKFTVVQQLEYANYKLALLKYNETHSHA